MSRLDLEASRDDVSWGMLTVTPDGRILFANACIAGWLGYDVETLVSGMRFKKLLSPVSRILHETHYAPLLAAQGYANEVAFELTTQDGRRLPVLVCAVARTIACGGENADRVYLTLFDATETRRHERELTQARRAAEEASGALAASNRALFSQKEALRVTLRSIVDAVVTLDSAGVITSINPTGERLTGVQEIEAIGSSIDVLGTLLDPVSNLRIDADAAWRSRQAAESSILLRRRDNTERHIAWTAAPILDEGGAERGTVVVCHDVTDQQAAMRRLEYEATHDHLTGLVNRREFERRLAATSKGTDDDARGEEGRGHALCYLDLDQFKIVNDTSGHVAGDQLLIQIAALLQDGMRSTDTFARLGGDEFGVLLLNCPFAAAVTFAENLRLRVAAFRFNWQGRVYAVTASIGVSVLPSGPSLVSDPLTDADIACNAAKEGGRNRVHGLKPDDLRLQSRRGEMSWVGRIRRALDEDRFELQFQPIAAIGGGAGDAPRYGEILLRLRDEDGRLLAPGALIMAAERYSQMEPIDRWVVRKSCEWLVTTEGLDIAINLSGQSFGNPNFLSFVIDLFDTHRVASRVCFEITETAAIADLAAALHFIETLRPMGVRFALDDFGSGLSSFAYLKTLPVDLVKIDGTFVKTITTDAVNRAIVESIQRVARLCDLQTVAEWVEDETMIETLASIGIDYAQGWAVGRPMALADVASTRENSMLDRVEASGDGACCVTSSPS